MGFPFPQQILLQEIHSPSNELYVQARHGETDASLTFSFRLLQADLLVEGIWLPQTLDDIPFGSFSLLFSLHPIPVHAHTHTPPASTVGEV